MEHHNRLTPAEAERLAHLAEECGELIQSIGKVLRHGWSAHYTTFTDPEGKVHHADNRIAVMVEAADVTGAINALVNRGDIDGIRMIKLALERPRLVAHYMHHQG